MEWSQLEESKTLDASRVTHEEYDQYDQRSSQLYENSLLLFPSADVKRENIPPVLVSPSQTI